MRRLLVAYDLGDGANSFRVSALLRAQRSWVRVLPRLWLIETDLRPAELRDRLKPRLGEEGRALVIEVVAGNWASTRLNAEIGEWLRQHSSGRG